MKYLRFPAIAAALALVALAHGAWAACPSYPPFSLPYEIGAVAASSGSVTDTAGNLVSWSIPAVPASTQMAVAVTITPATCGGSTVSADGTISNAPGGAALITSAGTWKWSTAKDGANYILDLNGQQPVGSEGVTMEVAHGGQLYVIGGARAWYEWNGRMFVPSSAP